MNNRCMMHVWDSIIFIWTPVYAFTLIIITASVLRPRLVDYSDTDSTCGNSETDGGIFGDQFESIDRPEGSASPSVPWTIP